MLIYSMSVSVDGFIANREGDRYGRARSVGLIPPSPRSVDTRASSDWVATAAAAKALRL
jgi:hypothetical protein